MTLPKKLKEKGKTHGGPHKYKIMEWGKNKTSIHKCVLNCSHYIPSNMSEGVACICWGCGREFTLGEYSRKRIKPKCPDCINRRSEVAKTVYHDLEKLLEDL